MDTRGYNWIPGGILGYNGGILGYNGGILGYQGVYLDTKTNDPVSMGAEKIVFYSTMKKLPYQFRIFFGEISIFGGIHSVWDKFSWENL